MASLNFDASEVEPNAPIEVLPPGDYLVQIVQSEMKDTKNGQGQMLWLEMDILDGEMAGRKIWDRLNLVNQNEKAVEIARRTLSAICRATGQMHVNDSEQLHFKPIVATVKVKPAEGQYSASNEVKGYKPTASQAASAQPPVRASAPQAQAPAPAATKTPPWKMQKSA